MGDSQEEKVNLPLDESDFDWKKAGGGSFKKEKNNSSKVIKLEEKLNNRDVKITNLENKVKKLENEKKKLENELSSKKEEFQGYKKRVEIKKEQAAQEARTEIIESMGSVRESLKKALEQDTNTDIREGVESTLNKFDQCLDSNGIDIIKPEIGEEPDANKHEVMVTKSVEGVQKGRIVKVFSVGYEIDNTVLKPAQVVVSNGK